MKYFFLFFFSTAVWANFEKDFPGINKFYVEEYINPKNYPVLKKEEPPKAILDTFRLRLENNPTDLRNFLITYSFASWNYHYVNDRAFALFWEAKFEGRKLKPENKSKVIEAIYNQINEESLPDLRRVVSDFEKQGPVFAEKIREKIRNLDFK